jgi:integrase
MVLPRPRLPYWEFPSPEHAILPIVRLTQAFVDKLRAPHPSGKQVLWFDTETKGFGVQVSGTTSAIDYVVQRDLPNKVVGAKKKTRRVNLGRTNTTKFTLDVARELAEDEIYKISKGIDPKAKVEPAPQSTMYTLGEAKAKYFIANKKLSDGSKRAYGQIERHLVDWLDLPLSAITSDMVEERHQAIADGIAAKAERYDGKTTANVTMVTLRVLWRWAARRISLPPSPVDRLQAEDQWFPTQRRTTRVAADKLPAFYQFVRNDSDLKDVQRDFLLMLLFTGFRKTETAWLRWVDIDLVQRVITLPAPSTKTKHMTEIPMSDLVHDLLVARRALGDTSEFVFPSYRAGKPISDAAGPLRKLAKATGIVVTPHALRRTYLKVGASARVSVVYLKALANHALAPDQTVEYITPTLEDLREPAQQVAGRLLQLCAVQPVTAAGANVIKHAVKQ